MEPQMRPRKGDRFTVVLRKCGISRHRTEPQSAQAPSQRRQDAALSRLHGSQTSAIPESGTEESASPCPPKSTILASDIWKSAVQALSPKQRDALGFDGEIYNLQDEVLDLVVTKQRLCIEKQWTIEVRGKTIVLQDVSGRLLRWVDRFKVVGDLASQFDPVHAALPWAGFRFLLQVVVDDAETMGAILASLESITHLLAQCSIYERLYFAVDARIYALDAATILEDSMKTLYTKILIFLAEACLLFDKHKAIRMATSIFNSPTFTTLTKEIELQASVVWQDSNTAESTYTRRRQDISVSQSTSERAELLSMLANLQDPIRHIDEKTKTIATYVDRKIGEIEDLTMAVDTGIQTPPRVGRKSAAESELDRQNPAIILSAIVKQLATKNSTTAIQPVIMTEYKQRENEGFAKGRIEVQDSLDLILELPKVLPRTIIVLDALDECDRTTRESMIKGLHHIIQSATSQVKVFLSSRDDDDIAFYLERTANLRIDARDNRADINRFVEIEIERCIQDGKLLRGRLEASLVERVIKTLQCRADGKFLWVDFQIRHLCMMSHKSDIEANLGKLPKGLKDMYLVIWSDILGEAGTGPEIAKVALMWIFCARRHLSSDELIRLVSRTVFKASSELLDIETLLRLTHNLLVFDERSNHVRFAHLSVLEFLEDIGFEWTTAHAMTSETCLFSLLDRELPSSMIHVPNHKNPRQHSYECRYWPEHLEGCILYSPALTILLNKFLTLLSKSPAIRKLQRWTDLEFEDIVLSHLMLALAWFDPIGLAEQNTQFAISSQALEQIQELFVFASRRGRLTAVKLLSELPGVDINAKDKWGRTAMVYAIDNGHLDTLEYLIEVMEKDSTSASWDSSSYLMAAARQGYSKIVSRLIDSGADITAETTSESTALAYAASNGHLETVEILLQAYEKCEKDDNSNQERRSSILLPEEVSRSGWVAFQAAAKRGHEEVVRRLADRRDELISADYDWLPFLQAASAGHAAIVDLLLENATLAAEESFRDLQQDAQHAANQDGCFHPVLALQENEIILTIARAAAYGSPTVIELLLEYDPDLDIQNLFLQYGRSSLYAAIEDQRLETIKLLFAQGVIRILLSHLSDVNITNDRGSTALHLAVECGRNDIVDLLLREAVDITIKDMNGRTALDAASHYGYKQILETLLAYKTRLTESSSSDEIVLSTE
ncbi:ankyrin [Mollisia scopiformis]|uniref:Ankyrin n=1 Tax=Mollisia scopiformis TaxID=149040 RepID=A0A132BFP4_MOLSC|nr:ankyrin [Mollisia scopiformis]KUJ10537.1 ankyrin [Mollisia scopiformis]